MLVSIQSLEKRYGSETVFSGISFTLDEGHRVALVGNNGAGKSTVMKIIAGAEEADSGTVTVTKGKRVAYLPQEVRRDDDRTGIAYIRDGTDMRPHEFAPVLNGLGLSEETAERRLTDMSGGQQSKILLTRFLLEPSDVLLLDEPTNNLDIPSLLWLESYLASSRKAMILISHDVVFLDTIATRVLNLKDGAITMERGSYSDYIERRKKEFVRRMKEYTLYTQKVRQLEKVERTMRGKGERIDATDPSDGEKIGAGGKRDRASAGQRTARVMARRIKKMEKVEKPFEEEPFTVSIAARNTEGDAEIVMKDMIAGRGGVRVGPLSLTVKRGERLCFLGMNGAGKSTLLQTVTGALKPVEGTVEASEGIVIGDVMQQHERAERSMSASDFFMRETGGDTEKTIHILKRAGFTEQMMGQRIAGLSSGMRARLLFAVFAVLGVNVLVLDEPTNHLDMEAVSALKDLLKTYDGMVLLVSHNRWFLEDARIDAYYGIEDGAVSRIRDFQGYVNDANVRAEGMIRSMKRVVR